MKAYFVCASSHSRTQTVDKSQHCDSINASRIKIKCSNNVVLIYCMIVVATFTTGGRQGKDYHTFVQWWKKYSYLFVQ